MNDNSELHTDFNPTTGSEPLVIVLFESQEFVEL